MADKELESHVKDLRVADLEELSSKDDILDGLWEQLPQNSAPFHHNLELLESNKQRAESIKGAIDQVKELHSKVLDLRDKESRALARWKDTEREMYLKIEPYSYVGISNRLQRDIDESKTSVQRIAKQIVDPELKPEDALILTKRYCEAKQQSCFKQNMLDSMN